MDEKRISAPAVTELGSVGVTGERRNIAYIAAVLLFTVATSILAVIEVVSRSTVGVLVALLGLAWIALGYAREKQTRRKVDHLRMQFERSIKEAEQLNRSLEAQREAERDLLAKDLFSGIGQELTALRFVFEHAWQQYERSPSSARETLATLRTVLGRCGVSLELLVNQLRPRILTEQGLLSALNWVCVSVERGFELACALTVEGELQKIVPEVQAAIFRIVQEALNNVVRHAKAKKVTVLVRADALGLLIEVRDDGCGISPDARSTARRGITNMLLRAKLLDGELSIKAPVEGGTLVRFTLRKEDVYVK